MRTRPWTSLLCSHRNALCVHDCIKVARNVSNGFAKGRREGVRLQPGKGSLFQTIYQFVHFTRENKQQ
ncbi:hypothetical protein GN956_G3115 [Arapaima gigas]